jgi:hypothetical protein
MADSYKPAEKAISESQAAARLDLYTPKVSEPAVKRSKQRTVENRSEQLRSPLKPTSSHTYHFYLSSHTSLYLPTYLPTPHTAQVSTWGIFPRAKDISKAYGGGKTLPLPDKYPKSSLEEGQKEVDQFYTESQRIESVNAVKIKDALVRSRNLMQIGSRQKAVALLEGVKDLCSLQTGGEIWLELGMGLETVGRSEESRKVRTVHINIHTYIYIHIYIHPYIYMYIYIYTYKPGLIS